MQTKQLRTEDEIMKNWPADAPPLASICCMTYNHEAYISDAIEGFLIQETDFPFEILIHDDASTDGTADVIRKYQAKYPKLFNPVYQTINQYSQGKKPGILNLKRAKSKYIAMCEGDDYWTDSQKLQTQVDFLEAHPDYVVTYHNAIVVDQKRTVISDSKLFSKHKKDYSSEELLRGGFMLTLTLCFRNSLREFPPESKIVLNVDKFIMVLLGTKGHGKYLGDTIEPAVYRTHPGGIWSSLTKQDKDFQNTHSKLCIYMYLIRIGEKEAAIDYLFNNVLIGLCKLYPEKNPITPYLNWWAPLSRAKNSAIEKLNKLNCFRK